MFHRLLYASRSSFWLTAMMAIFALIAFMLLTSMVHAQEENRVLRIAKITTSDMTWVQTYSPETATNATLASITNAMFARLVSTDREGTITPDAAEEWFYSDDGMFLTFRLKKDQRWSDGEPVTAIDVLYSFERLLHNRGVKNVLRDRVVGFDPETVAPLGIKILDDYTIRFAMTAPYAAPPALFSERRTSLLPQHAAPADMRIPFMKWEKKVSGGLYAFDFLADRTLFLTRNPHSVSVEPGYAERVEMTFADSRHATEGFANHKFDVVLPFREPEMEWLLSRHGEMRDAIKLVEDRLSIFLALNPTFENLRDVRVREALRLAVDHEAICDILLDGTCFPEHGMIPQGFQGYVSSFEVLPFEARVERARELMRAAGYSESNRLNVELSATSSGFNPVFVGLVASGWRSIFVDPVVDAKESEYAVWREKFYSGVLEIALRKYNVASSDGYLMLCANKSPNCGYFEDKFYEDLIIASQREPDPQTRQVLLQTAENRLIEASRVIPLVSQASGVGVSSRIDLDRSRFTYPIIMQDLFLAVGSD